jgi:hypothetical protein
MRRWLQAAAFTSPILVFVAVYGPAAGLGFVRDDYSWVQHSRLSDWPDLLRIVGTDLGFYRPAVGLTFTLDGWLFGWNSAGYGLTNLLLALGCAWAIASVARGLGLPRGAALLAGALWLIQPDFLPISVLWISGRTALLMILGSAAAAAALIRGRLWLALVCLALSLFSKEEAVVFPFVSFVWLLIVPSPPVRPLKWALSAGAVEAIYFLARGLSGATSPVNAPPFYRFTFDPATVAGNLTWYLVHACGTALTAILMAWLLLRINPGASGSTSPASPQLPLRPRERSALLFSVLWILASICLTMWLPVRSRLYLALPAAGASLAAAACCAAWWTTASERRRRLCLVMAIGFALALVPAHLRGAREWTARTSFAAVVLGDLGALTSGLSDGATVVLVDDPNDPHGNLASVFGTMANEAAMLASGRRLSVWIEPAPPHAAVMGLRAPCPGCAALRLKLAGGRLRLASSP